MRRSETRGLKVDLARLRVRAVAVLAAAPLIAAAPTCGDNDGSADLIVINRTDRNLDITAESPRARTLDYSRVEPDTLETVNFPLTGQRIIGDQICTSFSFVVRRPDGRIVDRLQGPVCPGETWTIENREP